MSLNSPSPAAQKAEVKELIDSGSENTSLAAVDDEWYVISLRWFAAWKEHVDFNDSGREGAPAPGPINNLDIIVNGSQRLRNPTSGLGADFDVVSDKLFNKLLSWYSVEDGSPTIVRKVIQDGSGNVVEISAPVFDLWEMDEASGIAGRPVEGGAQVTLSRKEDTSALLMATLEAWLKATQKPEPEADFMGNLVRFWFSLGEEDGGTDNCNNNEEDLEAITTSKNNNNNDDNDAADVESKTTSNTAAAVDPAVAAAARQWHMMEWERGNKLISQLQIGDRNITVARAPRILMELRASKKDPWILPTPEAIAVADAADAAAADAAPSAKNKGIKPSTAVETEAEAAAKAAQDAASTAAATARAEARAQALELADAVWRAQLTAGAELDVFDGKQWRESVVVGVGGGPEEDEDAITVRFRNMGPDHLLATRRSAGADLTAAAAAADHKPEAGAIAKPYTHVSDWRTQLRQDMKIQVLVDSQHTYHCAETVTTLHCVPVTSAGLRSYEWWVSDPIGAENHNRRGYMNAKGELGHPPLSSEKKKWELWVALPGVVWQETAAVRVTLEGPEGKEDVRIVAEVDAIKAAHPGFAGQTDKLHGLFKRQPGGSWQQRKVVRVDYKKREVTLTQYVARLLIFLAARAVSW